MSLGNQIIFERDGKMRMHVGLHTDQAIKSAAKRMGPNTKVWMLTQINQFSDKSWYTSMAQDIVSGELLLTGEKKQVGADEIEGI